MEARWSARRVTRQIGRSDCVVTSGSERCHLHKDQAQDDLDRPVIEKTAPSNDDNRVRVWRLRGERINPAFTLQRHTASTAGVMVWGVIAYNTRSPLVLIRSTMTAQRFFQQDNARPYTAKVLQDCLHTVTTLTWAAQSPDLSPIEHIWDHLGWRVGYPTSMNELEAKLQQIWNGMSEDIIQNLFASMPDRIASCIRAEEGSAEY
ncbi:transposable element Tcb1 transposase [Trichonephila clavipes]|nr:transposable element Tcb1 transposase [Trichonephila clavipes]